MPFEKEDLHLTATVFTNDYNGTTYADADWYVDATDDGLGDVDFGGDPKDVVGIGWEHSDYEIDWDSWYSDINTDKRKAKFNGVAFEHCAKAEDYGCQSDEWTDGDNEKFNGYANVQMFGEEDIAYRSIIVNYTHAWSSGSIDSVSIDATGMVSASFSYSAEEWDSPVQAYDEDNYSN